MPTPDQIQAAVAVLGVVGAILGGYWRLAVRMGAFQEAQNANLRASEQLRIQVAHSAKRVNERLDLLTTEVGRLKTDVATFGVLLHEREKDIARLEGSIENLGAIVTKQIAAVATVSSQVDAAWRTLQRIHPDKVPKRASDGR